MTDECNLIQLIKPGSYNSPCGLQLITHRMLEPFLLFCYEAEAWNSNISNDSKTSKLRPFRHQQ